MTDLTILIAVIALALWPLAFLVLRIRHERKKRRDRLDRMTKEDLEDIGTEELVIAVLKKIGCQPETNEEGHIVFKYQGDDFYIAVEDEARFIMIWNPWWASISMDNPALPYLKEIVNLVNVDSLVTLSLRRMRMRKTWGFIPNVIRSLLSKKANWTNI